MILIMELFDLLPFIGRFNIFVFIILLNRSRYIILDIIWLLRYQVVLIHFKQEPVSFLSKYKLVIINIYLLSLLYFWSYFHLISINFTKLIFPSYLLITQNSNQIIYKLSAPFWIKMQTEHQICILMAYHYSKCWNCTYDRRKKGKNWKTKLNLAINLMRYWKKWFVYTQNQYLIETIYQTLLNKYIKLIA